MLENLGFGLPGAGTAAANSPLATANLWFFNAARDVPRIAVRNCTLVVPLAQEVDQYRYWAGVFNSLEPSAWLRSGAGMTAWEVRVGSGGGANSDRLEFVKLVSAGALMHNVALTARPQIAPRLPMPGW